MDDLGRRLDRLAPAVDTDAALAALRHGSRARRWEVALAAAAFVALIAGVIVANRTTSRPDALVAGEASTSSGQEIVQQDHQLVASTSGPDATLTVTTPSSVVAGQRLWITASVRALATLTYGTSGSCRDPVQGYVNPEHGVDPEVPQPRLGPGTWDGDSAVADDLLYWPQTPVARLADERFPTGCTTDLVPNVLRAGEARAWRLAADVRIGTPKVLPEGGRSKLVVHFKDLSLHIPIEVVDDPQRQRAAAPARRTLVDDPRLHSYVVDQRAALEQVGHAPDVVQTFRLSLEWWQGAWELEARPAFLGGRLRLRAAPDGSSVRDARVIVDDLRPDDDPDAPPRAAGAPPDVTIPPP